MSLQREDVVTRGSNIEGPAGDGSRKPGRLKEPAEDEAPVRRIVVDKRTHRTRLEK